MPDKNSGDVEAELFLSVDAERNIDERRRWPAAELPEIQRKQVIQVMREAERSLASSRIKAAAPIQQYGLLVHDYICI